MATDVRITLQVGDRRFVTMRDTLTSESASFASLLSGGWGAGRLGYRLEDGSYFIDADPTDYL